MSLPLVSETTETERHLCECQALMKMPLAQRREQIKAIEAKRGLNAADHIRSTLMAMHTKGVKR